MVPPVERRRFLATLGALAAAGPGILARPSTGDAATADLIERNTWPEHWETSLGTLGRSWLTRNDRFFVRSHFPAPEIDPATYRLEVSGLVQTPLSLSLGDLQSMTAVTAAYTLECAGNGRSMVPLPNTSGTQWGRGAVGNARWTGVRLSTLLTRAGIQPDAKHVWFEPADEAPLPSTPRFVRSIPIEKATRDVLLAHTMNDEPLPHLHGAPLRAVVPGWYGMASTKWITRIRVEAAPSDNHFMVRGYRYNRPGEDPTTAAPVEEMRIKSVITQPLDGDRVPLGKVRVQGFAWGPRSVRLVETSRDGGKTWSPAGFMGETSPMAWRHWATEIDVKSRGPITVMARATDGAGTRQPLEPEINAGGYANNAIHKVSVRAR